MHTLAVGSLIAMQAASSAMSAGSKVASGYAQKQAYDSLAQQNELQLQGERTQAALESEQRQRELARVLSTQQALFGSSGIDTTSGSPLTLREDSVSNAQRAQDQADLMSGVRQNVLGQQADDYRRAGKYSMLGGVLGAGTTLFDFGVKAGSLGKVPSSGGKP